MKFYVIIDTNVIVSAFYSDNSESSTFKVIDKLYAGDLIPLYSEDIINEYKDVLGRDEFNINRYKIGKFINHVQSKGIKISPDTVEIDLPDKDDVMFYQLVMDKTIVNDKFLITGNIKHFPKSPIIVKPDEFIEIYNKRK